MIDIGILHAPDGIDGEALKEWERLAPHLYRLGTLRPDTYDTLKEYCGLHARYVELRQSINRDGRRVPAKRGGTKHNPALKEEFRVSGRMLKHMRVLGMTPLARKRLEEKGIIRPRR